VVVMLPQAFLFDSRAFAVPYSAEITRSTVMELRKSLVESKSRDDFLTICPVQSLKS
jgi:hypothetical protein